MNKRLKIVFMGTPEFAIPSIDAIYLSGHSLDAVVTTTDKRSGRGRKIFQSPIKKWAISNNVPLQQPSSLSDKLFLNWLAIMNPDLIVVVAYGKKLPAEILNMPPLCCINLHASYLPAYRGAAPIHRAVMDGVEYSGVSVIELTAQLDAGSILSREKEILTEDDTAGDLHDRLAIRGASLLVNTICKLATGTVIKVVQDERKATYADSLKPQDESINWCRSALELYNQIRGLNPWPVAYTTLKGKRLKIWKAQQHQQDHVIHPLIAPGTVVNIENKGITVATGCGLLEILEVQPAGKRKMDAVNFVCGYDITPGMVFGQCDEEIDG